MSGLLAGKVWHSGLPSLLKPLAACLADEGNDRGQGIYPSIAYLAWKLGSSERSVQRGMHELREIGVIREVDKKKFGRTFLPVYFMDVSKLPYRKPWAESRRGDTGDVSSATGDTDGVTSNGDGVTPVTRRGDTAMAPNPLVDPLERPVSEEESTSAARSAELDGIIFATWWDSYPRKLDELGSQRLWAALSLLDRAAAFEGVEAWKKSTQWQDEKFIPHPVTFLKRRQWENKPAEENHASSNGNHRTGAAVPHAAGKYEHLTPERLS